MSELALVERIRRSASSGAVKSRLALGIGDDCAIYRPKPGEELLFTTDQMIEGVHFRPDAKPGWIGERALARSLSDIASMGGEPRFCLVALALPKDKAGRWADAFFRGLLKLAERAGTALAGGDLAHDDKVHCDVMVCGSTPRGKALLRSGAKPGDTIYVSGPLGKPWERQIEPRLELGRSLRGIATSCIDLSDGLSIDLHRLCKESGVAAELDTVPLYRGSTVERALHGGEDYELLWTARKAFPGATRIGRIVQGEPGRVVLRGVQVPPLGYEHF